MRDKAIPVKIVSNNTKPIKFIVYGYDIDGNEISEEVTLHTKEPTELALEFLGAAMELLSIDHFRAEMNLIEDVAIGLDYTLHHHED